MFSIKLLNIAEPRICSCDVSFHLCGEPCAGVNQPGCLEECRKVSFHPFRRLVVLLMRTLTELRARWRGTFL